MKRINLRRTGYLSDQGTMHMNHEGEYVLKVMLHYVTIVVYCGCNVKKKRKRVIPTTASVSVSYRDHERKVQRKNDGSCVELRT